jgi:hypothetical protein
MKAGFKVSEHGSYGDPERAGGAEECSQNGGTTCLDLVTPTILFPSSSVMFFCRFPSTGNDVSVVHRLPPISLIDVSTGLASFLREFSI